MSDTGAAWARCNGCGTGSEIELEKSFLCRSCFAEKAAHDVRLLATAQFTKGLLSPELYKGIDEVLKAHLDARAIP